MSRVPDSLLYNKANGAIARTRQNMLKTQEQATSGLRINRASDDPVGNMRANQLKSQLARNDKVTQNMDYVNGLLSMTDTTLAEITDVVSRVRELSIQASSSTNQDKSSLEATANEIDQLAERAVQLGNSRYGDRYIFGGFQIANPPFDSVGNYFGDDGQIEIEIDQGQRLTINTIGTTPFYGIDEIPLDSNGVRQDPKQNEVPSIKGDLRAPASILAQNRGLDIQDDDLENQTEFAKLKERAGVNLIGTIRSLSEGMRTSSKEQIQGTLNDLDRALQQVISARSTVGAKQNSIDRAMDSLNSARANGATLLSDVQDADTVKVFSDMSRQEHVLNATLETNKKLLTPSLMDFLK